MTGRVAVASLGGTISMTSSDTGVTPTLGAAELIGGLEVGEVATLATVPGASLTLGTLLECFDWACAQVSEGAPGVVVVQGTDTLEETAYFLECLWPFSEPLVVTGALRHPAQPGADGPANLAASVVVAGSPSSRGRGVMVVLNDEVHAARWVRKTHASRPDAFSSAPAGPLGLVAEGAVHYFHPATERLPALPRPAEIPQVVLLEAVLDSGDLLDGLDVPGVVIAASGVGHVCAGLAEAISRAPFPVVVASRIGAGTTFAGTYGFTGSESDLIARGAVMAGWLCPRKARLLLRLLLATGGDVRVEFERRGRVL